MLVLLGSFKGSTIEVFLLNTFATTTAVGFFAIALTLTRGAVQLFSVGLTSTLLPYMAKSFGQHGHRHATHFLAEATRFYWAVGIAIAGLGLVTTPEIVTLMYGNRYLHAIPAIEAIPGIWAVCCSSSTASRHSRPWSIAKTTASESRSSPCWPMPRWVSALIPHFGLAGAVLTYAGTRVTELGLAIFYLRRATTGGIPVAPMARLFCVGVAAAAAAWLVTAVLPGRYGFLVGALVFVAMYVPSSILVHYWTDDDYRLMTAITSRLGPGGRMLMRLLNGLHRPWSKTLP